MLFLISVILLLSQFHCVFSNEKQYIENVELFNEFINGVLDKKSGHSKHEAGMRTLNVADAVKILVLVEKNVAEKIAKGTNHGIMEIDEVYSILCAISHDKATVNKLEDIISPIDKVQFLMLLLSFATRLAFTIGSEALEKHVPDLPMNSFVLAYKHLETVFPFDMEYKGIEYKFRYYQEAILEMGPDQTAISFKFTAATEKQQMQRKNNFDTLHFYLTEWKVERVLHLYEKLQEYSKIQEGDVHLMHHDDYYARFLDRFMRNWNGPPETDRTQTNEFYHFNPLSLFVLKNFAANLIKRMLREKQSSKEAALYFEEYPHLEIELNRILAELNGYLEENRENVFEKEHDNLVGNEMLLHYENAIKINWGTKEELISLNANIVQKIQEWKESFEKCGYNEGKIHCDVTKIIKEIENNRKAFESLHMNNINVLPLYEELEKFRNIENPNSEEMRNHFTYMTQVHKDVWNSRNYRVKKKMEELIENVPLGIVEFEKYSKEEHIMNILFNQFIKSALDIPENDKKAAIGMEKCAKLLELVEKNVAHKIDEKVEEKAIDDILIETFKEFNNFEQNAAIRMMEQELNKRFKKQENKVHFLTLLLSFAARLAFTIGSDTLEKHGFQIALDSFVLAFKHLEKKFHTFRLQAEEKRRYYQGAILHMNDEENESENTAILFDFSMLGDELQKRREENFETIHTFLKKSKEQTVKVLLLHMNIVLSYDQFRPDSLDYHGVFGNFFNLLKKFKNKQDYTDAELLARYKKEIFFGMKNFALNLGKRILRMKEHSEVGKRFFANDAEQNSVYALNVFEKNLKKHRNEAYKYDKQYMYENEIFMHYEDAIQIDWRTKEDITEQAAKMRELLIKWEKIIKKCSSGLIWVTNCKLEEMQEEMEKVEIKELFGSFKLQKYCDEILTELKKCAEHKNKKGKNMYTGSEVKQLLTNWKKDNGLNLLLNLKMKMDKEIDEMFSAV